MVGEAKMHYSYMRVYGTMARGQHREGDSFGSSVTNTPDLLSVAG